MEKKYNNRFYRGTVILLIIFVSITGYYALKLKEKYNNQIQNNYIEAFSNLVNYVNNVENYPNRAIFREIPRAASITQKMRLSREITVFREKFRY